MITIIIGPFYTRGIICLDGSSKYKHETNYLHERHIDELDNFVHIPYFHSQTDHALRRAIDANSSI